VRTGGKFRSRVSRWLPWRRREARDADLDRELQDHLELEAEEQQAIGLSAQEAAQAAHRAMGNTLKIEEDVRAAWGFQWLEILLQDLRYASRQLRRNPGFAAIVVVTLALGIGANTAIFSVINGVFLRPLPYPQPSRLVYALWVANEGSEDSVGAADYLFWKEHTRAFESAGAYEPASGSNLMVGSEARFVRVTHVSPGLFATLGVNPMLGRGFTEEEGRPNGPHAIMLSYPLWRSAFRGDRHVIGHTVQMNGAGYIVAGVMPPNFEFVASADVYTPLQLAFDPNDHDQNYGMVARLRSGVTFDQAQAEVAQVFGEFKQMYAAAVWKGWRGLQLISYHQELTGNVRTPLLVLFGAVFLVLLIAIANVTSLFLGRAAARRPEIILRTALGASRWRLRRQLLTEGLLLSFLGGTVALFVAVWGLRWLLAVIPQTVSIDLSTSMLPLGGQVSLNASVLAFTFLVSVIAGVAAGFFPYLHARALNPYEELKQGAGKTDSSVRRPHARSVLVVAEIAISVVLLAGAGLLVRSFLNLRAVNPGFRPEHLWALQMSLPPGKYTTTAQAWALQQHVMESLEAIPGVTGVASASNLPVERGLRYPYEIPHCGRFMVQLRAISPNYFRVMGIPVLAGREFSPTDGGGAVIVNSEMAQRCWPGHSPIGQPVGQEVRASVAAPQVVGVVGDTKEGSLDSPPLPAVYVPQWTVSDKFTQIVHGWFLSAWVICSQAPLGPRVVSDAVNAVDPTLPVAHFERMTNFIADSFTVSESRLLAGLLGGFTAMALLLAAIGVYGILSLLVTRRTHEIGVRMALGAGRSDVLVMVVGQGLRLALTGLALGMAGALALTRVLASLLFQVKPTDSITFVAVAVVLTLVALLACYIPARKAMRVDPMDALRYE
jgi:putative ABC transport system permease protein